MLTIPYGDKSPKLTVRIVKNVLIYLSLIVGGDSSHVVVDGGQDRDGLFGDIHASEDHGGLRDAWQAGGQLLWREMVQLQVRMVLLWATSPRNTQIKVC